VFGAKDANNWKRAGKCRKPSPGTWPYGEKRQQEGRINPPPAAERTCQSETRKEKFVGLLSEGKEKLAGKEVQRGEGGGVLWRVTTKKVRRDPSRHRERESPVCLF